MIFQSMDGQRRYYGSIYDRFRAFLKKTPPETVGLGGVIGSGWN